MRVLRNRGTPKKSLHAPASEKVVVYLHSRPAFGSYWRCHRRTGSVQVGDVIRVNRVDDTSRTPGYTVHFDTLHPSGMKARSCFFMHLEDMGRMFEEYFEPVLLDNPIPLIGREYVLNGYLYDFAPGTRVQLARIDRKPETSRFGPFVYEYRFNDMNPDRAARKHFIFRSEGDHTEFYYGFSLQPEE